MLKIISTSSLIPRNGLDTLIQACSLLKIRWQLTIAGDGPEEEKLKKLAKGLPVQFLGRVTNNKIPQLLRMSNLFVRPSRFEGFGSSFIEAMAAGIPVIGTPVGGITDFIDNKKTGLLVPPNDYKALAEAMEKLYKDKTLYHALVKNGRRLVRGKYDWDLIASQVYNEMEKLCF